MVEITQGLKMTRTNARHATTLEKIIASFIQFFFLSPDLSDSQ
jgi:hypothetical protein